MSSYLNYYAYLIQNSSVGIKCITAECDIASLKIYSVRDYPHAHNICITKRTDGFHWRRQSAVYQQCTTSIRNFNSLRRTTFVATLIIAEASSLVPLGGNKLSHVRAGFG